ncbi:DNA pol A exo1 domain containing protein [Trichuris trichiura]|uniref:DNA pol A exo1 domain containing protein n=1 Tax=Trichuris trichiura TaxID=36087 RepID=A0A077YXN9_TRITR|nr:DNA pol A exo1 domain containing protein [Trichuris trichiura]
MSSDEQPTVSNVCEEKTIDDVSEGISNLKPTVSSPCDEQPVDDVIKEILKLKTISESDLESMFTCVKKSPVRSYHKFSKLFKALPNPLCNVLQLIESCPDGMNSATVDSMKRFLSAFFDWKNASSFSEVEVTEELKVRALNVMTAFHMSLLPIVDQIYGLKSAKELCIAHIRTLIKDNRYCDAAGCALRFELCSEFNEVDIALPLVLLHEQRLALSYLECDVVQLTNLLRLIDSHLHPLSKFHRFVRQYRPLKPKRQEFAIGNAERFLKSAIKRFKLNVSEVAPNFEYRCLVRGVHYFIKLRYKEMELPAICFSELMDDILLRYPSLRNFTISEISKMNDMYEVYRICQLFGIDGSNVVYRHFPYYGGNYPMPHGPLILAQDLPAPTCLRLPPNVFIRFVRDAVGFKLAVEHAKRARLAALDTEWAPTIGFQSEDTIAALLQMAIGNIVYLVEIDELVRNSSAQDIIQAFEELFCSVTVLKLGYDFSNQDVKALISAVPFCTSVFSRTRNLVCIRNHALSVINSVFGFNCPKKFSSLYNNQKGNCGLKNLCKVVLDVDLDKRQRLSNWKRRPLRPEQVEYAALDVYCLLMIYQKLSTLAAST